MPKLIQDEFSHLFISSQRRYQLRAVRDNKCRICGQPAIAGKMYCLEHYKAWAKKRVRVAASDII